MGTRLLVVEDEAPLARAISRFLSRMGYDVSLMGSCAEAQKAEGPFSLGVFDIDLPDGDGIELADCLRQKQVVRRVVFFSGSVDPDQRNRAITLGAFVEKADGVGVLRQAVLDALSKTRRLAASANGDTPAHSSAPPPSGVRRNGDG